MNDAPTTQNDTGETLRRMRQAAGVSQKDLASALGVTPGHLSHVEAGNRPLTRDLLHRAATHIAHVTRGAA